MGRGTWDSADWTATRSAYTASAKPTVDHIYKARHMVPALDPVAVTLRESRDSVANPASTALILGLDVTGSMSIVLDHLARVALGTLVGQIYSRKPITDPHIMVMGIGDLECDQSPLQVTQFEAENQPLVSQMESLWLERGGGGNDHESYAAAWLFAAHKTSIDCFEKRGKRGYLFTVGDEQPTPKLYSAQVKKHLGIDLGGDISGQELFQLASATYEIFHVIVEEGSHARTYPDRVRAEWAELLGQHTLHLSDHKALAEAIVSAIEIAEGRDRDSVIKSWGGNTSLVVANATRDIARGTNIGSAVRLDY